VPAIALSGRKDNSHLLDDSANTLILVSCSLHAMMDGAVRQRILLTILTNHPSPFHSSWIDLAGDIDQFESVLGWPVAFGFSDEERDEHCSGHAH
jgi:hypothetical protein